MATLDEAHQQLQAWIAEIDQHIDELTLQRRAMAATLVALGHGNLPDRAAEAVIPVEPPAPPERAKRAASQPTTGVSKYDYSEIARVASAAERAGLPMGPAVSSRLGVSKAVGPWLVKEARRRGFDVPTSKTKVARAASTNVTPIAQPPAAKPVVHEGNRAFTPADTLQIIEGGASVG